MGMKTPKPNPSAPLWAPWLWTGDACETNSCYPYALNCRNLPVSLPQPGGKAGLSRKQYMRLTFPQLMHCIHLDGAEWTPFPRPRAGFYLIALASAESLTLWPNTSGETEVLSIHWYRQDADGFWSHKPGKNPPSREDASGRSITDPRNCDRGRFTRFHGYFYVPQGGFPPKRGDEFPYPVQHQRNLGWGSCSVRFGNRSAEGSQQGANSSPPSGTWKNTRSAPS